MFNKKGSSLFEQEKKKKESRESGTPWTLKLAYNESKVPIIFLVSLEDAPTEYIHKLFFGTRDSHVTVCLGEGCPLCQAYASGEKKAKPTACCFFSVLDMRPYTKKDGTEVKFDRKILAATSKTYETIVGALNNDDESQGELKFAKFLAARGPEGQPSPPITGDIYSFKSHVDLDKLGIPKDQQVPFTLDEVASTIITDAEEIAKLAARFGVKAPEEKESSENVSYDLDD